jgi:hypothetical protein
LARAGGCAGWRLARHGAAGTVLIGPAVLALVAVCLVVERVWPAERRPIDALGHRQDAAYLALYVVAAVPGSR